MGHDTVERDFLQKCCKASIRVFVFLTSGVKLEGYIKVFDDHVILLGGDNDTLMAFKHAIATILPSEEKSNKKKAK